MEASAAAPTALSPVVVLKAKLCMTLTDPVVMDDTRVMTIVPALLITLLLPEFVNHEPANDVKLMVSALLNPAILTPEAVAPIVIKSAAAVPTNILFDAPNADSPAEPMTLAAVGAALNAVMTAVVNDTLVKAPVTVLAVPLTIVVEAEVILVIAAREAVVPTTLGPNKLTVQLVLAPANANRWPTT